MAYATTVSAYGESFSDVALPGAYAGAGLYVALPIGTAYAAFFNLGETIQGKGKYGQVMVPGSLPNTPISGHFQTHV